MELENTKSGELSQAQKDKYCRCSVQFSDVCVVRSSGFPCCCGERNQKGRSESVWLIGSNLSPSLKEARAGTWSRGHGGVLLATLLLHDLLSLLFFMPPKTTCPEVTLRRQDP